MWYRLAVTITITEPPRNTHVKLKHPFIVKALGAAAAGVARLYRRTIDWKALYFDPTTDTVHPEHAGRFLYLTWHEYMLMPILLRGSRWMRALASTHGDGELICNAMRHLGWHVTRGSSTRGGTAALFRLLRNDGRHITITPDGPRGPRRTMSPGVIYLASRLGIPIVCTGYGYHRAWRARSWDQFAIPRALTRGRAIFGPPLLVPPGLDRDGVELYREWFERLLNWLTTEAEEWAAGGHRKRGEVAMIPNVAPPELHRPYHTPLTLPPTLAADWAALTMSHSRAA